MSLASTVCEVCSQRLLQVWQSRSVGQVGPCAFRKAMSVQLLEWGVMKGSSTLSHRSRWWWNSQRFFSFFQCKLVTQIWPIIEVSFLFPGRFHSPKAFSLYSLSVELFLQPPKLSWDWLHSLWLSISCFISVHRVCAASSVLLSLFLSFRTAILHFQPAPAATASATTATTALQTHAMPYFLQPFSSALSVFGGSMLYLSLLIMSSEYHR